MISGHVHLGGHELEGTRALAYKALQSKGSHGLGDLVFSHFKSSLFPNKSCKFIDLHYFIFLEFLSGPSS